MDDIRIDSPSHPLYNDFIKIYRASFPIFEQRTEKHQEKALLSKRYTLRCYLESSRLAGFMAYWDLDNCIYIEHYAVSQEFRGLGYGARYLENFVDQAGKPVILEIDPVTDVISHKRLEFYQRLGFVENAYQHTHPPYRSAFTGHPLKVLSSHRALAPTEYEQFNRDLTDIVMES